MDLRQLTKVVYVDRNNVSVIRSVYLNELELLVHFFTENVTSYQVILTKTISIRVVSKTARRYRDR